MGLWKMRMPGIDISDVYYDAFLINGKKEIQYPEFFLDAGQPPKSGIFRYTETSSI